MARDGISHSRDVCAVHHHGCRYTFGDVILADVDALQSRPPIQSAASLSLTISNSITPTTLKIISFHERTAGMKATTPFFFIPIFLMGVCTYIFSSILTDRSLSSRDFSLCGIVLCARFLRQGI
jgi:hypothetical protein